MTQQAGGASGGPPAGVGQALGLGRGPASLGLTSSNVHMEHTVQAQWGLGSVALGGHFIVAKLSWQKLSVTV